MQNLWRELRTGPDVPETVYVIVEIPKGSRNKYEYQKVNGVIFLDRVLYSSMVYPGDYGLIPQTFYEDGDPLDILVLVHHPTFPGCVIQARPIGMFKMLDRNENDAKVLAVPANDPAFDEYKDIADVAQGQLNAIAHFFEVYKDLEGQRTKPIGWVGAAEAKAEIERSVAMYKQRFGLKEL